MAPKQVIAVVGATGAQGGGLARAILHDPSGRFAARAITRNVESPKARALADAGAEVVAPDEIGIDRREHLRKAAMYEPAARIWKLLESEDNLTVSADMDAASIVSALH